MSTVSFLAAGAVDQYRDREGAAGLRRAAPETATDSFIRAPSASAGSSGTSQYQDPDKEAGQNKPHEETQNDDKAASDQEPTRIVVTVSRENPIESLSRQELERIFLRQRTVWPNGWPITVYERHTDNPIREEFSMVVLGKRPSEQREYWLNLKLTRGLKAPKVCRSAELVKQYTVRVKGAIGYMYEPEVDDTVRALMLIPIEERGKRD